MANPPKIRAPKKDEFNLKFFKTMALIFIPTSAPLALAIGTTHVAFVTPTLLSLLLAAVTITPHQNEPYVALSEEHAMKTTTATSPLNRTLRVLMGGFHLYGAIIYSIKSTVPYPVTDNEYNDNIRYNINLLSTWPLIDQVCRGVLILCICLVSGIWFSSGYNG